MDTPEEIFGRADLVMHVKEPQPSEYRLIRKDQIVFTYLHLAAAEELTHALIKTGSVNIAYETIQKADGSLPLLTPMSEVAGRMAIQQGAKYLEMAQGGTLFLDEISELSSATQAKILRVLQEMEFIRVGGVKPVKVDVRVIVATNRDLEKEVSEGRFRSDLFYRINVVPIFIPPLRERKGDIPLLVDYFLSHISSGVKNMKKQISKEALELFVAYDWPGNVRELENVIERLVALTPKNIIDKDDLPANILIGQKVNKLKGDVLGGSIAFNEAEQEFEQEIILNALKKSNFVQTKAANLLGISRRVLKYKMDKYGIEGSEN